MPGDDNRSRLLSFGRLELLAFALSQAAAQEPMIEVKMAERHIAEDLPEMRREPPNRDWEQRSRKRRNR